MENQIYSDSYNYVMKNYGKKVAEILDNADRQDGDIKTKTLQIFKAALRGQNVNPYAECGDSMFVPEWAKEAASLVKSPKSNQDSSKSIFDLGDRL